MFIRMYKGNVLDLELIFLWFVLFKKAVSGKEKLVNIEQELSEAKVIGGAG